MTTQPEALRLADVIANDPCSKAHHDAAAAELRRLNEEVETNGTIIQYHEASIARLTSQRDALLEAYRKMKNVAAGYSNLCDDSASTSKLEREFEAADAVARAAIKAVEEGK